VVGDLSDTKGIGEKCNEFVFLLDVFVAFFADFVIGHPDWLPRPEKFIEWIGKYVENIMRRIINISSSKKVKALERILFAVPVKHTETKELPEWLLFW